MCFWNIILVLIGDPSSVARFDFELLACFVLIVVLEFLDSSLAAV